MHGQHAANHIGQVNPHRNIARTINIPITKIIINTMIAKIMITIIIKIIPHIIIGESINNIKDVNITNNVILILLYSSPSLKVILRDTIFKNIYYDSKFNLSWINCT